jgi:hypothetical protein
VDKSFIEGRDEKQDKNPIQTKRGPAFLVVVLCGSPSSHEYFDVVNKPYREDKAVVLL